MKRGELEKYWKKVIKQGRPAEAKVIDPASVVTAPWVRLKCKYGCEMYGREYCCPPETPTPEQTREILDCYQRAILFHYRAEKKETANRRKGRRAFLDAIVELEGEMFKDGYYKAFALLSGPCGLCAQCAKPEGQPCNFGSRARPSMESCGIDVYQTAWNNGYPIQPLRRKDETQNLYCLMLVD
jgi:predicted metal-binding protein